MFRKIRIQVCYVIDVTDAVTKAADLKVSFGERLDILDFQASI